MGRLKISDFPFSKKTGEVEPYILTFSRNVKPHSQIVTLEKNPEIKKGTEPSYSSTISISLKNKLKSGYRPENGPNEQQPILYYFGTIKL